MITIIVLQNEKPIYIFLPFSVCLYCSQVWFFSLSLQFKNYTHDSGKAVRRIPKRKQHARDSEAKRRSALNVRLFLREFCIDFLENCYNRLMYLVKVCKIQPLSLRSLDKLVTLEQICTVVDGFLIFPLLRRGWSGNRPSSMMRPTTSGLSASSWPSTVATVSMLILSLRLCLFVPSTSSSATSPTTTRWCWLTARKPQPGLAGEWTGNKASGKWCC